MKKFTAYTLAEIMIAMVVIGVMAVITIKYGSSKEISERSKLAKVYKVFNEIQKAASDIRATESTQCPEGTFLTKIKVPGKDPLDSGAYTYEYALFKTDGLSYAATADVSTLFAKHMDFEEEGLNFCSYTGYCSDSNKKGGKIVGDMYIGFEVTANTSSGASAACPTEYFIPQYTKENIKNKTYYEKVTKTAAQAGKCWGKVYVYLNSRTPSNTHGKDIFIWGLGENGIAY